MGSKSAIYPSIKELPLVISLKSFLLFSIISITAAPLALVEQLSAGNLLPSFLIGVGITAGTGLFLLATTVTLKRIELHISTMRLKLLTLSLIGVAGALRGLFFYQSVVWLDFSQPSDLFERAVTSTATTLFWLTLISVVVEENKNFKLRFEALFKSETIRRAHELSLVGPIQLNPEIRASIEEIEVVLNKTFDQTIRTSINRETLLMAAFQLRQTIDEKIRPLSHRLWVKDKNIAPKTKFFTTLVSGLRFLDVPPSLIANSLGLISLVNLSSALGLIRGLVGTFTVYVVSYTFFSIYRGFLKERFLGHIYPNLIFLLTPGLAIAFLQYLENLYLFDETSGVLSLVYVIITANLALLISAHAISIRDKESILEVVNFGLRSARGVTIDSSQSKDAQLASFLHNSLQSEILALSYQLQESSKSPDSEATRALLEQLGSRINRSINDDFESFVQTPLERLKRVQSAWRGIADIQINFPTNPPTDELQNYLLVQIIEESISNAVRFSGATEVSIDLKYSDENELILTIAANGSVGPQNPAGLGTEWLELYAPENWQRTFSDSGSVLRINL